MTPAAPAQHVAYLGLGSNLGDSLNTISTAIAALDALADSRVVACSQAYHSTPWGVVDQPDFINAVVALETRLTPLQLLAQTQALEKNLGRQPSRRWGERVIDIDILLYGHHWLNTPDLTIPHPWLSQRAFVLQPLLEIAPDIYVPGQGSANDLWQQLQQKGTRPAKKNGKIVWYKCNKHQNG